MCQVLRNVIFEIMLVSYDLKKLLYYSCSHLVKSNNIFLYTLNTCGNVKVLNIFFKIESVIFLKYHKIFRSCTI